MKQTPRFAPKPIQGGGTAPDTSEDGLSRNRKLNGIARLRDAAFALSHSQQLAISSVRFGSTIERVEQVLRNTRAGLTVLRLAKPSVDVP
ncbi:MAG: hypothetical protein KIS67_28930 [Verrucomicrobiae bacterium]|nr:hypothetical protein [Verrucomicrobiae bacterium]